jgi:hypothetical protein
MRRPRGPARYGTRRGKIACNQSFSCRNGGVIVSRAPIISRVRRSGWVNKRGNHCVCRSRSKIF